VEEWVGAVVRHDYPQGQPGMAVDLIKPSEAGFLPAVLEPGDKAVTIAVDPAQIMSGLILPGDRVDVLLVQSFGTQEQGLPPARRSVGETLLRDVRVIALDQRISDVPKTPSGSSGGFAAASSQAVNVPKTVTLEVSLADAQRLLVASQLGHVSLAMRGPATARPEPVTPTWASDASPALLELSHGAPKAASGGKSSVAQPQVQVIHGSAKTERLCVTGSGGKLSSDCSSAQ
jgi:pilus assembly protein CpaB